MDVNGDASPARFKGGQWTGKRLFSVKDRRLRDEMFEDPALNALNDASNLRILDAVIGRDHVL